MDHWQERFFYVLAEILIFVPKAAINLKTQ